MTRFSLLLGVAISASAAGFSSASAQEQAGRDACVAQLRKTGGPDAQNGIDVLKTEWSQAGTMVTMRDAGGSTWECIGYDDGTIGDLSAVDAMDDGEGAMAENPAREGAEKDGTTETIEVKFQQGTTGATYDTSLTPGSSSRYVLGAREGQFLDVQVLPDGPGISYQIFNPDGSFLLDLMDPVNTYQGQLWQSGDHIVEVINRGNSDQSYRVIFAIR